MLLTDSWSTTSRTDFTSTEFFHSLNPSPSPGRACGLKEPIHLSPVHALHFGVVGYVNTPAPRQQSRHTNSVNYGLSTRNFLTLSAVEIGYFEEQPNEPGGDQTQILSTLIVSVGSFGH